MKNMKRVISTVLMLCMMAALLCVPAFATNVVAIDSVSVSVDNGVSEISADYAQNISVTAKVGPSNATYPEGKTIEWSLNNAVIFTNTTSANGTASITLSPAELQTGNNTIKARVVIDGKDIYNTCTVNKKPAQTPPSLELNRTQLNLNANETAQLIALINGVEGRAVWTSSNTSVATVSDTALVTAVGTGNAIITATHPDNGAIYAQCTVYVSGQAVTITPVVSQLSKGQTINLEAKVNGANFSHWFVDSNMASYISIANNSSPNTTLTARAATSTPITLYAYADNGASNYIRFTIVAADALQIETYPSNIANGELSSVYVVNPIPGEEFTWSITPSAAYGVLAASRNLGTSVELTAGPVEGRVTVTATSKSDASRSASATVYVNSEAVYGNAKISPIVASWTAGQPALKFEVSPAYFKSYMDGKLLTSNSGYYTYYNGILTLNTSLLSSLSSGEHTLKVYTSSNEGVDGLVYATIYITGSASNVYGDNAHVRGSAYNLYFNSTDPIKEVYISNQWIDPANYSIDGTGRRLTLNADFLNKLGYGSYTMKLVTQNGYTETANFRIVTANYAPATGDDSNMGVWMMLLALSVSGAIALIPKRKKSTDLVG